MKINFLSKALLMGGVFAMVACSENEPVIDGGNGGNEISDGAAYMSISIKSADRMSKAINDGGYAYGTGDEQRVRTVDFFFFDKTGASMDLNAYLVDPNTNTNDFPLGDPSDDKKPNVEKVFSKNLLVLEKLTGNTYPSYMLTVINAHGFKAANNITNTLKELNTWESTVKDADGKGYFVMSTSSYDDEKTDDYGNDFYNVTPLKTTDIYLAPGEATANKNAVEVYVERLAAKVQVSMAEEFKSETLIVNGETLYKLSQSVGGNDNTNPDGGTTADTQLYLRVKGWNLNTTAKESYMSKNIDAATWNATDWGWIWNKLADYRSYWAKSWTYGKNAEDIKGYVDYLDASEKNDKGEIINNLSNPVAASSATAKALYCNENTNAPANVVTPIEVGNTTAYQVDSRVATNAVLATQIVDEKGEPVDMISVNGVLFREDGYMQYILNRAYTNPADLNIYTHVAHTSTPGAGDSSTEADSYKQIGTEYFKSVQPTNPGRAGAVEIVLDEAKFIAAEAPVFYYFDEKAANTSDDPNYKEYGKEYTVNGTAVKKVLDLEPIKTAIKTAQDGFKPVIYENGWNIYYIPIEHLAAEATLGLDKTTEGYYGVVRNHWYKLTINSFSKVGHGIWDPTTGEHIETLEPDDKEDPLYYLGATINILSWKVVEQDVEL